MMKDTIFVCVTVMVAGTITVLVACSSGHGGHAQPEPAAESLRDAGAATKPNGPMTVYFCAGDHDYGLSYAAPCPRDGAAMKPREATRDQFEDLANSTCPVCEMPTRADLFAVYKGVLVRLGCPGCHGRFFAEPERFVGAARADEG